MTFASWPRSAPTPTGGHTYSPTPTTPPKSTTSPNPSGGRRGSTTTTAALITTSPIDCDVVRSPQVPTLFRGKTFPLCGLTDALSTPVAADTPAPPSPPHALELPAAQLGQSIHTPPLFAQRSRTATDRAARPDYRRWLDHVASVRGCERPIRLAGHLHTINPATGEVLSSRPTEILPDGVIYVPCGDRRATVCPACAETYRADTYQLIRAGLVGGKGVPDTVATHPVVFATFTAPTFGAVHTRLVDSKTGKVKPCRMRRSIERCPHGRVMTCPHRHTEASPCLGQPLCSPELGCPRIPHHVVVIVIALRTQGLPEARRGLSVAMRAGHDPAVRAALDGSPHPTRFDLPGFGINHPGMDRAEGGRGERGEDHRVGSDGFGHALAADQTSADQMVGVGTIGLGTRRAHTGAAVPAGDVDHAIGQGLGWSGGQDFAGGGVDGVQVSGQADGAFTASDCGDVVEPSPVVRAASAVGRGAPGAVCINGWCPVDGGESGSAELVGE